MKKVGFRPSPAMVVACVALFVALGGTATAVTYVVSSNSQIGPNTVSGHKPPTGKHANIIGGSVNATDLANGAATLNKLAAGSVNGGKVVNGSLAAADTNTASIQRRISGSCPADQAAQSVVQDGSLNCGVTNGGTPGGLAEGDLSGTYPNPSLDSGVIGASELTPLGNGFDGDAVPLVVNADFSSGTVSSGASVDHVIYNGDAPTSFRIIDAWIVYQSVSGCSGTCTWQLRTATGGGGNAVIPSQSIPVGLSAFDIGDIVRIDAFGAPHSQQTIPAGGTLVVRFTNPGPGTGSDSFDLHLLAVPVP